MPRRLGTRTRIGIAALLAGALVAGLAAAWFLRPAGDDTDVAAAFLRHAFAGRIAEARAMMTPGLRARLGEAGLAAEFADRAPVARIRFDTVRTVGNNRTRTTWLEGVVTTAGDCEVGIEVEIRNDLVEDYALARNCPSP